MAKDKPTDPKVEIRQEPEGLVLSITVRGSSAIFSLTPLELTQIETKFQKAMQKLREETS